MSSDKQEKIHLHLILEVLGKPPEHIHKALKKLIESIEKEKGVLKITNQKINEAKELEKRKDLYVSFAEIELEVENPGVVPALMFKYMPSHIEVVYPENITINNQDWNDLLNELTRKLHYYDEVARTIQNQKKALEKELKKYKGKNSEKKE